MNDVIPTIEEATTIIDAAIAESGMPIADPTLKLQAVAGVFAIMRSMQHLGWRVTRPLATVASSAEPNPEPTSEANTP